MEVECSRTPVPFSLVNSYLLPGPLVQCFSHQIGVFFSFFSQLPTCLFSQLVGKLPDLSLLLPDLRGLPTPEEKENWGSELLNLQSSLALPLPSSEVLDKPIISLSLTCPISEMGTLTPALLCVRRLLESV